MEKLLRDEEKLCSGLVQFSLILNFINLFTWQLRIKYPLCAKYQTRFWEVRENVPRTVYYHGAPSLVGEDKHANKQVYNNLLFALTQVCFKDQ